MQTQHGLTKSFFPLSKYCYKKSENETIFKKIKGFPNSGYDVI